MISSTDADGDVHHIYGSPQLPCSFADVAGKTSIADGSGRLGSSDLPSARLRYSSAAGQVGFLCKWRFSWRATEQRSRRSMLHESFLQYMRPQIIGCSSLS